MSDRIAEVDERIFTKQRRTMSECRISNGVRMLDFYSVIHLPVSEGDTVLWNMCRNRYAKRFSKPLNADVVVGGLYE